MDMSFSIPTAGLEFAPQNVTLSDPRCHVHTTGSHLKGRTALNACGTSVRMTNDSLIFSNFIILPDKPRDSNNDENDDHNNKDGDNASSDKASRSHSARSNVQRVIPVECQYHLESDLRLSFLPVVRQILFTETGVGEFQFRIEQFRDASFRSRIEDSAYPLRVTSDERMFIQVSLAESVLDGMARKKDGVQGGYGMEVDTCVSSTSPSLMAVHNHSSQELVVHSCPANEDVHVIANSQWENATRESGSPGPHHFFRFSFKPKVPQLLPGAQSGKARSSSSSSMVLAYIHCRVRLCATGSCNPLNHECPPTNPSASSSDDAPAEGQGEGQSEGEGQGQGQGHSGGEGGDDAGHREKRAALTRGTRSTAGWKRDRRSVSGAGHHLSTGPLLIMEEESPRSAASPLVVALGAVAGMSTLITVSVVVAWALTRTRQDQYDLTASPPAE